MAQTLLAEQTTNRAPAGFGIDLVAGTPVMTLQGILPVEHLLPDDRIVTRSGAMRIGAISTRVARKPDLLRISAHALDNNQPEEDVLLTADQSVHLRDWRAKALFGTDQATVPAYRLADGTHIRRERPASARIIRIGLPREALIYAGGMELATSPAQLRSDLHNPSCRKTPGKASGMSSAIRPGPKLRAAST